MKSEQEIMEVVHLFATTDGLEAIGDLDVNPAVLLLFFGAWLLEAPIGAEKLAIFESILATLRIIRGKQLATLDEA